MSTKQEWLGITIDLAKDNLLTDTSRLLLREHYMVVNETSPQHCFARAAVAYCNKDLKLAQRIYEYVSNLWFMYASPVLSNAPAPYFKSKGLPISCFLSYVPDSIKGLDKHSSEIKWLTVKGGGVAGHWNDVRAVSDIAPGPIPFLAEMDKTIMAYSQGKTRRGAYAAYLDIDHPDIEEFIECRKPTGQTGDSNRIIHNLHNAVNITDKFWKAVSEDADFDLIDPHDKTVRKTVKARYLWEKILSTRFRTGEPYIHQIDESNRHLPPSLKNKGLKIHGSNLCSEITLPTGEGRTAVCCLSSVNIEKFEEWQSSDMIADLVTYLDNVLQHFIDNAPEEISFARDSAKAERSLGLGAMGFASYLRLRNIPFESQKATSENYRIFKYIRTKAYAQSVKLGHERGVYDDCDVSIPSEIRRNAHLLAIAPNANSSVLVNTSPGIEPLPANLYNQQLRIGDRIVKCKSLERLLEAKGMNNAKTWLKIASSSLEKEAKDLTEVKLDYNAGNGSVQGLDFLTEEEKIIYKTAYEIDQRWVVDHARIRQEFIDQAQSVNLFFPYGTSKTIVNIVHLRAFSTNENLSGVPLKTLYYLRTFSPQKAENMSDNSVLDGVQQATKQENIIDKYDECLSCHG